MAEHQQLQIKLESWLAAQYPQRQKLSISSFSTPDAGASNETLLFDVSWQQDGQAHSQPLVARLEAAGEGIFPSYDLELQYRSMQRLKDTDVKVPLMLGIEMDPAVIGK